MTKTEELEAASKGDGCLGRSKDDEPIFILCARDPFAAVTVREWADLYERRHAMNGTLDAKRKAKVSEARLQSRRMEEWRAAHPDSAEPSRRQE